MTEIESVRLAFKQIQKKFTFYTGTIKGGEFDKLQEKDKLKDRAKILKQFLDNTYEFAKNLDLEKDSEIKRLVSYSIPLSAMVIAMLYYQYRLKK